MTYAGRAEHHQQIVAALAQHREQLRAKTAADRVARYAKALADTLVAWDASDPGAPETRDEPGEQPSPAVVFLQDDALVGFPHDSFFEATLCQAQDLKRFVPFNEQGHNHSEEEPNLCLASYHQRLSNGRLREFDPLDYPPGQSPTENVIEPCPAYDNESVETVVTSDDVARRISACWNALRGIPTEALERYSESIATLMDAWVDCRLYRERMESLAAKTELDASPASQS